MTREELVDLVRRIQRAEGTEDELDALVGEFDRAVVHPRASNLIFWPGHEGFERDAAAEEIVDAALAYRPIEMGPASE